MIALLSKGVNDIGDHTPDLKGTGIRNLKVGVIWVLGLQKQSLPLLP